jgi:3',5'-cyclic AMP phosphodiesterase CpdA
MRRFGISPATAREQVQKDQTLEADEGFHPLPPASAAAPYRLALSEVVENLNPLARTLHIVGDTGGIANPVPQQQVVKAMIADLVNGVEACYHVGDWAYFESEEQAWVTQVFEAYADYNRALMGISGNHDAFDYANFMRYLGAAKPELLPETAEFHRDTMTQPNAYWTLTDDLVTIIGLATNVPSGGVIEADQAAWLESELAAAPEGVPLIVSLHHPPYSCDAHHGGSQKMGTVLDAAFVAAGRWPSLVLSGHVHDYQRFTRTVHEGHVCTYVVCGAGGYHNLHAMAPGAAPGLQATPDTVLEAFDDSQYGFLRLTVSKTSIDGEYVGVDKTGVVTPGIDVFSVSA